MFMTSLEGSKHAFSDRVLMHYDCATILIPLCRKIPAQSGLKKIEKSMITRKRKAISKNAMSVFCAHPRGTFSPVGCPWSLNAEAGKFGD